MAATPSLVARARDTPSYDGSRPAIGLLAQGRERTSIGGIGAVGGSSNRILPVRGSRLIDRSNVVAGRASEECAILSGRTMRVLATLTDPATIRRILEHLGVRSEPLARAPARDPTWQQMDLGGDADAA